MPNVQTSFALVFTALFFWGSWPTTLKISDASAEFYFIGYSLGCALASFCVFEQLAESDFELFSNSFLPFAFLAGFIANTGKFANIQALEYLGITVAHSLVLGIDVGVGTVLLYLMDNRVNAYFLFSGVFCVLTGVFFDILSELQSKHHSHEPAKALPAESDSGLTLRSQVSARPTRHLALTPGPRSVRGSGGESSESGVVAPLIDTGTSSKRRRMSHSIDVKAASVFQKMLGPESASFGKISEMLEVSNYQMYKGICLAMYAGCALGGWPLIFEYGTGHGLIKWEEFFFGWTTGLCMSSCITLPTLISCGNPDWNTLTKKTIALGMLGGFGMSFGIWLTFFSHEGLNFVVSMTIVRCAPVISAFWGIFVFQELNGAGFRSQFCMGLSLFFYLSAISLITLSILYAEEEESAAELTAELLSQA